MELSLIKTYNKALKHLPYDPHGYWLAQHLFLFNLLKQKTAANDATYNNTNERKAA